MSAARARGMTLLEVLLALSALALVVVLLTASLRVGLRAHEAGARRAAAQQEVRALVEILGDALSSAYPYRSRPEGGRSVVLFEGEPETVRFVTTAPPLVLDVPAAPFHAVVLATGGEDEPLAIVERLVPAKEPFEPGTRAVLSRAVTAIRFRYLDLGGGWQERWDGAEQAVLPAAVSVELTLAGSAWPTGSLSTFVVPLALATEEKPQ